jgi:hypothetical protein
MMDKKEYNKYLKSDYWIGIKEQVLERDSYKCRLCGSKECLNVHHSTYNNLYNEDLNDLITLCKRCHSNYHKKNPNAGLSRYIFKQKIAKQNDLKIQYINNIKDNVNIYRNIIDDINKYNYIYYNDFIKYLKNTIDKTFEIDKFKSIFFNYFDLVHIILCEESIIKKYNLPSKISLNKSIITNRKLYDDNFGNMVMALNIFDIFTDNIFHAFEQTRKNYSKE